MAVGSAIWYGRQTTSQAAWIETATRLQMLSQRASKTAQQAAAGNPVAFEQLADSRKAIAAGLKALIEGDEDVPSSPDDLMPQLTDYQKQWDKSLKAIDVLLQQRETLVALGRALAQINVHNTELLDLTQQLIALLPADARRQSAYAQQQALWTQRMAKNANALLATDTINPEAAFQLGEDLRTFQQVLEGLEKGSTELNVPPVTDPVARDKLLELKEVFGSFRSQVETLLSRMPQLIQAKQAARDVFEASEPLLKQSQTLTSAYAEAHSSLPLYLAFLFGATALGLLLAFSTMSLAEARQRAEEAARENRRNQDAILRLLNEMGDLAEGDLTVRATVTEDITGAIADSVNYAIDELRMLVNNINRATAQVTAATDEAKRIADELAAAAERQFQQIEQTGEAINQMSASIAGVSEGAAESARVAQLSLAAARKGGESVRKAIEAMNALRDQIQETAKRIKRLGESSQEIGEIVELIGDITEQTNVLALNAAIQAAAAGEAGRGFSVVAEEVQRLAERSANATRRIGAIVKAIQGDTQDAVNAMEVSTQGVVQGASLSDAAGSALHEIEEVSARLAGLIQNISAATQEQARTAEQIAHNMGEIREVTRQTSEGAKRSAQAMDQLTELAEELKVSVSGFKL
ncbi:MAG: methyl-accepting chemotaxis protein [Thiobacillaceae bacterium]|nr:methyl-accepting chemotaxis protein [Thiobacillaceae bacterium]